MGYTHGNEWSDELITKSIYEVMEYYEIQRMPSKSECEAYYGNYALTNKIFKTGGFYAWAEKLNLEIKHSETAFGVRCEGMAKAMIEKRGHNCETTTTRFPYDLLVDGCVKIDVKAANISKVKGSDAYSCNLESNKPKSDILLVMCFDKNKELSKVYLIPSHVMNGKKQLAFGMTSKKYDKYLDNWQSIDILIDAFKKVIA